jgi:hypothetical protein
MSKFKEAAEESKKPSNAPEFGYPPGDCKCGRSAVISLMTCINTNTGEIKQGPASTFCGRDNNNNPNGKLLDWYRLNRFDSFCTECWCGIPVPGERRYNDEQVRRAWRWMLGETCKGDARLKSVFPPLEMTDRQRDFAIEIVNYEAKRTGYPQSIPAEFTL